MFFLGGPLGCIGVVQHIGVVGELSGGSCAHALVRVFLSHDSAGGHTQPAFCLALECFLNVVHSGSYVRSGV